MTTTGQRLRLLREQRGQSQEEIAKLIGVGRTTYLKYESGENKPTRKLKELSELFNVTSDYIMGLSDNPYGETFGGQIDGHFLTFAGQQESEKKRINDAINEYHSILNRETSTDIEKGLNDFYQRHLHDIAFFTELAKQTAVESKLTRTERNILAHYRFVDEETQKKIAERTRELYNLYRLAKMDEQKATSVEGDSF